MSMRSNHSTWDPRRPLYEELKKPPPLPRRFNNNGSDECYRQHGSGSFNFSILSSNVNNIDRLLRT